MKTKTTQAMTREAPTPQRPNRLIDGVSRVLGLRRQKSGNKSGQRHERTGSALRIGEHRAQGLGLFEAPVHGLYVLRT